MTYIYCLINTFHIIISDLRVTRSNNNPRHMVVKPISRLQNLLKQMKKFRKSHGRQTYSCLCTQHIAI